MTSLIHLEAIWQCKYEELERDIEKLKKEFQKNKKCSCKKMECKHYIKEQKKLFNERLNKLLIEGICTNAIITKTI